MIRKNLRNFLKPTYEKIIFKDEITKENKVGISHTPQGVGLCKKIDSGLDI